MNYRPRLAVTLGDPRGVGPEVAAQALRTPIDAEITVIGAEEQIAQVVADDRISVGAWPEGGERGSADRARSLRAGQIAGHAVQRAVRLAMARQVDAIVTGPLEKKALHAAGFPFPGQTE